MGIWFCLKFVCMNIIGKDAEKKVGSSKFLFLVVRITKRKEAEFWRQCFWMANFKAYGKLG